jgi:hypothetical protein
VNRRQRSADNRRNFFEDRLLGTVGRRRLHVVADWLRAEFRHASDEEITTVTETVAAVIRERYVDGT